MQEASQQDRTPSRLLKFYSGYRLLLSAVLLWLGQLDSSQIYFGHSDSSLFSITAAGWRLQEGTVVLRRGCYALYVAGNWDRPLPRESPQ